MIMMIMSFPGGKKVLLVGVVVLGLAACGGQKVWYRQDTDAARVESDLAACRGPADDAERTGECMQARGYALIPPEQAELLQVRLLKAEGLRVHEIAARLDLPEGKVSGYLEPGYQLPSRSSLGRQPEELLTSMGTAGVRPLIAQLKDRDPLVRRHAAYCLGEIGDPRAVAPLIAALEDRQPLIRRHAAAALGKIGNARAVKPLISVLNDRTEEAHVRMSAAEALGQIGEPGAVDSLIGSLQDENWGVRSRSARALGNMNDPRALEPLICALQDGDPAVRACAADALGKMSDLRAVPPLRALAEADRSKSVRREAARALRRITGHDFCYSQAGGIP